MKSKTTNPKDLVGSRKPPISTIPPEVIIELGNALFEGHVKYGGHNWRAMGVRASVYYDAAFRHLASWWTGEDIDPDSGVSHVTKAIAGLVILRDAMLNGMLNDDRPPKSRPNWMNEAKARTLEVLDRYEAVAQESYTESNRHKWDEKPTPTKTPEPKELPHPHDILKEEIRAKFEREEGVQIRIDPFDHQPTYGKD